MTDFDDELAALRAELLTPSDAAAQRIAERLSRSIAAAALGDVSLPRRGFAWARPGQLAASFALGGLVGAGLYGALRPCLSRNRPRPQQPPAPPSIARQALPSSKRCWTLPDKSLRAVTTRRL